MDGFSGCVYVCVGVFVIAWNNNKYYRFSVYFQIFLCHQNCIFPPLLLSFMFVHLCFSAYQWALGLVPGLFSLGWLVHFIHWDGLSFGCIGQVKQFQNMGQRNRKKNDD